MGAMENAGCVTLRDEYLPRSRQPRSFYEFRCSVILHEMAHMWFGDLVTMRWWDDLWLNESFAEWACYHAAVEATEFTDVLDRLHQRPQADRLPPGPAAQHPPDRGRQPRPAGRRGQLRHDHLRQGRLGAQAAGGLGRASTRSWPACGSTSRTTPSATPSSPTCSPPSSGPRAASSPAGPRVAEDRRRQHADPRVELDDEGRYTRLAVRQSARPRLAHPASPPPRRRPLRRRSTARLVRRTLRRDRRRGRAHRGRRARSASRSPTCCCSTTATWPTPRSASTSAPWPPSSAGLGHARRLPGPRPGLGCGVGHDPRRRDARHRLRRPGAGQHRRRDRRLGHQPDPAYAAQAVTSTPPPPTATACAPPGSRGCARCCAPPSPAGTPSSPSPAPYAAAARSDDALDDLEGLLDGTRARGPGRRHRPALGPGHRAGPPRAGRRRPDRRGAGARRHHLRQGARRRRPGRAPTPRPRRRPGAGHGAATTPNETQRSIVPRSSSPARTTCSRRTSTGTSTPPTPCGSDWAPSGPRRRSTSCSRGSWPAGAAGRASTRGWPPRRPTRRRSATCRRAAPTSRGRWRAHDGPQTRTAGTARRPAGTSAGAQSSVAGVQGLGRAGVLGEHRRCRGAGRRRGRRRRRRTASSTAASSTCWSRRVRRTQPPVTTSSARCAGSTMTRMLRAGATSELCSWVAKARGSPSAVADEDRELDAAEPAPRSGWCRRAGAARRRSVVTGHHGHVRRRPAVVAVGAGQLAGRLARTTEPLVVDRPGRRGDAARHAPATGRGQHRDDRIQRAPTPPISSTACSRLTGSGSRPAHGHVGRGRAGQGRRGPQGRAEQRRARRRRDGAGTGAGATGRGCVTRRGYRSHPLSRRPRGPPASRLVTPGPCIGASPSLASRRHRPAATHERRHDLPLSWTCTGLDTWLDLVVGPRGPARRPCAAGLLVCSRRAGLVRQLAPGRAATC